MKGWFLCALLSGTAMAQPLMRPPQPVDGFAGHPRVAILSDIGNEPDDQMSFVRLMLYSNELDLEALIATTSTWQKAATHPETMQKIIAAYGEVRPHLMENAQGWPEAPTLDSRVFAGQPAYGMAATGAGEGFGGSAGAAGRDGETRIRGRCGSACGVGQTRWRRH